MTVDVGVWLGVLTQVVILIAAGAAGTAWLRKWLRKQVAEPLEAVRHEVKANQGETIKDAVDRTEHKVTRTEHKVDSLIQRFEEHLRLGHRRRRRG